MTNVLALDFDGVICDSAAELAHSAWRACQKIWPEDFADPIAADLVESYRRCRPVIKTGFESIPLVRMLVDGVDPTLIEGDFPGLVAAAMEKHGLQRDELIELFGRTRDQWMANDLQGWLAVHEFYPGVIEALNASSLPQFIITTKQKRFADALIDAAGLAIAHDQVFGLESGKKGNVLASLSARFPDAKIHFIEDRLKTLAALNEPATCQELLHYFALWGFNTAQERRKAAAMAGIAALQLSDFSAFAADPMGIWGR